MLDTRSPFTLAQAAAAGLSRQQVRSPRFRRVFHGVYVEAATPDSAIVRAKAALLLQGPEAIVSHTTAAAVRSLPVPRDAVAHVTVPPSSPRSKVQGIVCHVGDVAEHDVVGGVRVASPFDLFVQSAGLLELVDLVVLGDAIVRADHLNVGALRAGCETSRARHARSARQAARFVRARVDSPMESRLRLLLSLAGLPEPEVNIDLYDDAGRVIYRIDLSYPSVRVAIEYDGRHHIERVDQWQRDLRRREQLEAEGWRFVVVTARDIFRDPAGLIDRIHAVLKQRRMPGLASVPRAEWRSHFAA